MSQLVAFHYGTNVAVHYGAVEVDAVDVVRLHKPQALLVEVTELPGPNLGIGD